MSTHSRRIAAMTLAAAVALAVAVPIASADPSPETLATARAAAEHGQNAAREFRQGPKDSDKAVGLERAAEALAKVAEKRMEQAAKHAEKAEGEKPGNGFGRGHAAEVHAILAAGGSPSELAPHGESVVALVKAYQQVKGEDHPGRGHGAGGNPDGGGDDD